MEGAWAAPQGGVGKQVLKVGGEEELGRACPSPGSWVPAPHGGEEAA